MCSWLAGARLVSLLGLLFSCLCLVPVILVHVTGGDHSLLVTPLLISLRVSQAIFNQTIIGRLTTRLTTRYKCIIDNLILVISPPIIWSQLTLFC